MSAGQFWFYAAAMVMAGLICLLAALLVLNVRTTAPIGPLLRVVDVVLALVTDRPECPTCGHISTPMGEIAHNVWWWCDACNRPWLEKKAAPQTKAVA